MKIKNSLMDKIHTQINENKILKTLSSKYPEINELMEFNEFNVGEKLEQNAFLQEKFRLLYISEMSKLRRIEENFNKVAGERYDYYKYHDSRDLSKVEIERYYLPSDKELINLKKLIDVQQTITDFYLAVSDTFKSQGFNLKTFVENLKIGG